METTPKKEKMRNKQTSTKELEVDKITTTPEKQQMDNEGR